MHVSFKCCWFIRPGKHMSHMSLLDSQNSIAGTFAGNKRYSFLLQKLKDRITPHVTNFFRLRLTIEEQEGKRKYKSDGAVMVGEFVCMYVCMFMYSEWVRVWVSDASVVCVREGCESEWSEWSEVKWSEVKWSEVKWSEVKWSEVKWSEVSEWVSEWVR